jgi:hypothetical protein
MDLSSIRRKLRLVKQDEEGPTRPRPVVERGPRFALHGSVIYRPTGGLTWHRGTIENLSLSGMLLWGEVTMPVNTPIEMSFQLPNAGQARGAPGTFCWGKVVRTIEPTAPGSRPGLAVNILRYQSEAPSVPQIRFKSAA